MRNFLTPASIDTTKVYCNIIVFRMLKIPENFINFIPKNCVFKYDENSYLQQGEGEGEDDDIMIPSKEEDQATFSTVPLGNKDFKLLFSSDNKSSNFFLNEPLSYEIQERILMEDSHRSSELSDPHIPIEKFSEKMQLELITDMNRSSNEQEYTGNKNNGHEDNTKEDGSFEDVPEVDDFIIDSDKFTFPYISYNLPDDIFQPVDNNQSFSEEFPNENLVDSDGFSYNNTELLPKDNNSSSDIDKASSPLKSEEAILKDDDFAKISESYESLSFEMEDRKLPMQTLSASPVERENILEHCSDSVSEEVELDFEGFEFSAKNSVDSSSLEHKRVAIMKAISAQESRQESSELSSSEESVDSNEENVSPYSSIESRPDVQVPDVSTSGNIEDEREEKKILTKSKKENLSVGEERDKLHHLKGYQQIRNSFPDDIIERLKVYSDKKRSCTKILNEALLPKTFRKKCMSLSKRKSKMKKKNFKLKVEAWNRLLSSKENNNQERTLQTSSPDHNYCKTPEKRKNSTVNSVDRVSPDKKESVKETAKLESSVKVEISNDDDDVDAKTNNDVTNRQKFYNKLPEYCTSNIGCEKSQEQQQMKTGFDLFDKIKEEPENINDSPLLSVQILKENIVNEVLKNDSVHIKQEPIIDLEPDKKDIGSVYSRLPDYVTDIGNVKPKIDLPGVVFEKVRPQENIQEEQSEHSEQGEGCKKKKKLNLLEYRMRKMNSAESSRCCSPNVSANLAEEKMSTFNNHGIISEWSALHKASETREEGEIKEESGLSNISRKKNNPIKTKENTLQCRTPNKRTSLSRSAYGERKSRSPRQKRRHRPNETGKNKPTVIEIDLEAEEEEKKREEKIKAKLGFISNLNMPATSLGHSLLYSTKNSSETNHNSKYSLPSTSSSSRKNSKKRHYDSSSSSRSRSRSYSSKESSHRKRSKGRSKRTVNHRKSRRRLSRSRTRSESYTSLSSLSSSCISLRSRHKRSSRSNGWSRCRSRDNYGFVNFRTKEAAYAAYEYGEANPHLPFKVSFGNRRNFCTEYYSDLDALNEQEKYYNSANDMDYDTLFQTHRLQRQ
ncbi:Peroxisome proliferator-activated receptor gamma coactivator-related protein 1 [Armadillidium nasatum]|uniref:Peroxisome proliferator-activated receptor gamma coactivator-related protein 1 n=1 Tax=Armadillidium nasatum TaxID=96803 RepID=A0A5N5TPA8_9CRUS|nr:Peroxisome proliferator-activated receptor gamma coactivator-related protein 1 [Armadillidium nasatum]